MGFFRHLHRLMDLGKEFEADVVVGASDVAHVIMADSLSARLGIPLVVDLYDNFESYWATSLPGMKHGLKRATRNAAAISTVSQALLEKVKNEYGADGTVRTISNAVCPEIFHPRDKGCARRELNLPETALLVGTAGALSPKRGIQYLLRAFEELSFQKKDVYLILAGPMGRNYRIPENDRVRYLGELPQAQVGNLFNALDVGVVYNRQDQFAEYCFPQKFYEMIACGLPVVAANVGVMGDLLSGYEDCLYDPRRVDALVAAIEKQLNTPRVTNIVAPSWSARGAEFLALLEQAVESKRPARRGVTSDRRFFAQRKLN